MQLTKRERFFAIAVGLCAGIYLLDQFVLTPWMNGLDQMAADRQRDNQRLEDARRTLSIARNADRKIREIKAAGLPSEPSATESRILNALRGWAQESGVALVSLRPDRAVSSKGLSELSFQATGNGTMRSITAFLYRIETAQIPVRVHEIQIAVKNEGTDDLTIQLHLSTLWEEPPKQGATVASSTPREQP